MPKVVIHTERNLLPEQVEEYLLQLVKYVGVPVDVIDQLRKNGHARWEADGGSVRTLYMVVEAEA